MRGKTLTCKAQNTVSTSELQKSLPVGSQSPVRSLRPDPTGRVTSAWTGREEQHFL